MLVRGDSNFGVDGISQPVSLSVCQSVGVRILGKSFFGWKTNRLCV